MTAKKADDRLDNTNQYMRIMWLDSANYRMQLDRLERTNAAEMDQELDITNRYDRIIILALGKIEC